MSKGNVIYSHGNHYSNANLPLSFIAKNTTSIGRETIQQAKKMLGLDNVHPGDTDAVFSSLEKKGIGYVCENCDKFSLQMMRCSVCKKAYYCNQECQRKDWQEHKKVCNK